MFKRLIIFLLPLLLFGENLEVLLPTRSNLKPIYLGPFNGCEELRSVLEFDLNAGGFGSVTQTKEKVSFSIQANLRNNQLEVTVLDVDKNLSKKYPPLAPHRREIHKLADEIQKDLFGKEGIASQRIIYTQRTKTGTEKGHSYISEVWVSDFDGENARQITHENSYCLSPYFINQRGDFYYVSESNGQSKIYRASLSHPKGEMMIDLRGNQMLAALSKQGKQIAFISDLAGRPDLFIQDLDDRGHPISKPRQLFSAPRATQASPTYSPDGKQLAFVSDKDGPPRIYLLGVANNGQKPRLLTRKNRHNTSPSWSPDGTKLAYSAKVDGIRQIWIYDFATDEETMLTTGPENKENPSWAPDSFHLIYNTETDDISELYLIHLNRADPIQISKGSGQKRFASWEMRLL